MDDIEFAVWFAGAAEAGWEPQDPTADMDRTQLVRLPADTPPLSEGLAGLARSASAMHDGLLALAFADPADRMDTSGMAEATLARVAIESLATGLWLMLPTDDLTRQRRYASFILGDIDDEGQFAESLSGDRWDSALTKRYWEASSAKRVSTSRILREVDAVLGTKCQRSWRLYSGIAHGRPWAIGAWQRGIPSGTDTHFGVVMWLLSEPVGLARRFLEVADLRRRFQGQTGLEVERLERLREDGPEEAAH